MIQPTMFPVGLNIQICVHNISIILVCACVHRDYWCFEAFVDVKIPGAGDDLTMCKWVWECDRLLLFVYFQVNNGVVYLDYEDSHHHGLLCSFQ